jgi:3-hydroxyisobutyrate dehydrogenase-like beta-hydroxyacid dehydrogenase
MRLGFVGLGAMGFGMASNLVSAGHHVNVVVSRNRAPVEALVARGARLCADTLELARDSEVILLCLPNSQVVERVVAEIKPGLREGQILIDTGTSSLASTARLAEEMAALGVDFAEAPLAGGIKQAEAGELGALVGADAALFARIEPLLRCFCASVQHFGPVGAGGKAKFINNYMVMGIIALVLEAFHAADLAESDWDKLYDVVIRGSADSGAFRRIIGNAIEGDFKGYVFSVAGAHKDMRYITEMNEALGRATPLNRAVLEFFRRAEAEGYGDLMVSELLRGDIRKARGGV